MVLRAIVDGMLHFSVLQGKVICCGWAPHETRNMWRKVKVPIALRPKLEALQTESMGFHVEYV
jgi:hypothetical protein